jgi:hypothetical protein
MAAENPIWGEERIANELQLKLGIRVSPRTVGKYLRDRCGFNAGQIPRDLLEQAVGKLPVRRRRHGKDGD